jgi:protein-disulfide isomerase
MAFPRRVILALAAVLALGAAVPVMAQDRVGARDITLGNPKAPITIIEYASITCPHCARFNANVFPTLKARYIDTGKALYIFREFPTDPVDISAAGALIARCSGPDRYLKVIDALFRAQEALYTSKDVHAFFMAGGRAGGLSEEQVKACISDASALEAFNSRVQHAAQVDKINSTPTVIINGKAIDPGEHEIGMADIDAAIQPLLATTRGSAAKPVRRRAAQ